MIQVIKSADKLPISPWPSLATTSRMTKSASTLSSPTTRQRSQSPRCTVVSPLPSPTPRSARPTVSTPISVETKFNTIVSSSLKHWRRKTYSKQKFLYIHINSYVPTQLFAQGKKAGSYRNCPTNFIKVNSGSAKVCENCHFQNQNFPNCIFNDILSIMKFARLDFWWKY